VLPFLSRCLIQLFNSGALDKDPSNPSSSIRPTRREPIFKLTWTSFPDQATFNALVSSPPSDGSEPPSPETASYAQRGETLLTVLGGQLPTEQTGITVLQFPSYQAPAANVSLPSSSGSSATMSASVRSAFRDSLSITGMTFYPTPSPCDDFILMPRSSPHFNLSFDPIAIIFLLSPDPSLPSLPAPSSTCGLAAYTFPPVRSNDVPLTPGRKEFATPGSDFVPMTAAPVLSHAPSAGPRTSVTPWLSVFGSLPSAAMAAASKVGKEGYGRFRMPMGLWGGAEAVVGCEFVSPPRDSFKRAVRWEAEHGKLSDVPRLNLRGGKIEPDMGSVLSPDPNSMKVSQLCVDDLSSVRC
jgi:syntaxin-binding protein 5